MTRDNKTIKQYISTVGRRKSAVVRVRLYTGKANIAGVELKKGDVMVNGKSIAEYFKFYAYGPVYNKFLVDMDAAGKFIITARATGGGLSGQLDALILGVARALDKLDSEKYHKTLRDKGYLTRDPRVRERRKVGMGGKARRKKQSPKR